jgi:hypothetical protein
MVDTTLNNGCFLITVYDKRTVVRVGIDNTNSNGYIFIANNAWRSVEVGKEYRLTFQFDDEAPWNGTFTAINMSGTTALANTFKEPKFLVEFGAKQALSIYYSDNL